MEDGEANFHGADGEKRSVGTSLATPHALEEKKGSQVGTAGNTPSTSSLTHTLSIARPDPIEKVTSPMHLVSLTGCPMFIYIVHINLDVRPPRQPSSQNFAPVRLCNVLALDFAMALNAIEHGQGTNICLN